MEAKRQADYDSAIRATEALRLWGAGSADLFLEKCRKLVELKIGSWAQLEDGYFVFLRPDSSFLVNHNMFGKSLKNNGVLASFGPQYGICVWQPLPDSWEHTLVGMTMPRPDFDRVLNELGRTWSINTPTYLWPNPPTRKDVMNI